MAVGGCGAVAGGGCGAVAGGGCGVEAGGGCGAVAGRGCRAEAGEDGLKKVDKGAQFEIPCLDTDLHKARSNTNGKLKHTVMTCR